MKPITLAVPLELLSPESFQPGAPVELTLAGRIQSLEGDHATIRATHVNSCALHDGPEPAEPDAESIRRQAQEEDNATWAD